MKKLFVLAFIFLLVGCKKSETLTPVPPEIVPTSKLILVDKDVATSALVTVDSTKLTFSSRASGVDKIKVGSVLVSDMTSVAPDGFLRKVTSISTVGGNKVLTTEQAALTDVIEKGNVKFSKTFTDSDIIGVDSSGVDISGDNKKDAMTFSFNFTYDKVVYDQDKDLKTTNDQLRLSGSMNNLQVTRKTAGKYLHVLCDAGFLSEIKLGKEIYFLNDELYRLLANVSSLKLE